MCEICDKYISNEKHEKSHYLSRTKDLNQIVLGKGSALP